LGDILRQATSTARWRALTVESGSPVGGSPPSVDKQIPIVSSLSLGQSLVYREMLDPVKKHATWTSRA